MAKLVPLLMSYIWAGTAGRVGTIQAYSLFIWPVQVVTLGFLTVFQVVSVFRFQVSWFQVVSVLALLMFWDGQFFFVSA